MLKDNVTMGKQIGNQIMKLAKQDLRNSIYEATDQWNKRYHDHF